MYSHDRENHVVFDLPVGLILTDVPRPFNGVFNDAVSSLYCTVSNNKKIREK
jgi:hypothetical protein